ncbi:deoxyguanosinetriphosphate triphosphohydrolase [Clostridioides difficile]|nr:deoxyguanosinetriphosphate triphosphohydrolase [Clostridioides difficile]MDB3600229.1 deoxyguanosinetriphosphate triphosphohydrolase [Clostridioides difficile]
MEQRLDWKKLLCGERVRASSTPINQNLNINDEGYNHRNEFDKDYDRIVYSSSVRRLQDKAQVFPLQENDFTRTRLTHSLEASALARSFGYAIGEWLLSEGEFENYKQVRELSALLQVSALIHDLGNPPFGHHGEEVIRNWFKEWLKIEKNGDGLNEQQRADFENFEGNAQTLRIVSKLQLLNDEYGVNFTYATLATIMKYPWKSNSEKGKAESKFGYFSAEEKLVEDVFDKVGLKEGIRHPVTYLLEASDDIAYLLADVEDAVKKGILPWDKEYKKIKKALKENEKEEESKILYEKMFKSLDEQIERNNKNEIPESNLANIQNFKVLAQGMMFNQVVNMFKENYEDIMLGKYGIENLLKKSKVSELIKEVKRLAKEYCFVNKEVLTLELVGDRVINGLLDTFVDSLVGNVGEINHKEKEGKLYYLISDNFKYICCLDEEKNFNRKKDELMRQIDFKEVKKYNKLLLITDFISGMTDSYAVNLYKELMGVKLL